jgi:integrase/recombinase XerD
MTLQTCSTDFLRHCRFEKNLSAKTLGAYETDLRQFEAFLEAKQVPGEIAAVGKTQLRTYLEAIAHLKPKSIKRKMATLKALFNFLEFEDRIVVNPFRKIRIKLKEPKRLPVVLTMREVSRLFGVLYKQRGRHTNPERYGCLAALRDVAIVELLFATGARVSEIANLLRQAIDLQTGTVIIKGKGNKERMLHICHVESLSMLQQYRRLLESKGLGGGQYFFVNRLGKKLSDQSIRLLVKRITRQAGLTKRITPHVFRHSFATLLLDKDVDIKYIQSLLGHSSITTTQLYTHVSRAKQKQILRNKHPRRDLLMIKDEVSNNG